MTTPSFNVGSVGVGVELDASGARRKLQAAFTGIDADIAVNVDEGDIKRARREIEAGLKKLTADVDVVANITRMGFGAGLKTAAQRTIDVHARVTRLTFSPKLDRTITLRGRVVETDLPGGEGGGGGGGGRGGRPGKPGEKGLFSGTFGPLGGFKISQLLTSPLKALTAATSLTFKVIASLPKVIGIAGKALSGFGGVIGAVGKGLLSFAKNPITLVIAVLGALFAAFKVFTAGLGLIINLVQAAAGIFVMFGGALMDTVAAAAAAGPVIFALGAALVVAFVGAKDTFSAIGALNTAIGSGAAEDWQKYNEALAKLGDNAKSVVKEIRPFLQFFKDIRKELGERIFAGVGENIKKLQGLLVPLKSAFLGIGDALSSAMNSVLTKLQDPTVQTSLLTLLETSKGVIAGLGEAFANVGGGLINFFATIAPFAQKLVDFLVTITGEFFKWSATEADREALYNWFSRAWEIAGQVKDIVFSLMGLLFELFDSGTSKAGPLSDILVTIKNKLDEWKEWLNTHEEEVQGWFRDAKTVAEGVWGAIQSVIDIIKDLDSQEVKDSIDNLIGFFEGLAKVINGIASAIDFITKNSKPAAQGKPFGNIPTQAQAQARAIASLQALPPLDLRRATGLPQRAAGGIVTSPEVSLIGEAGPEAIIPLRRPMGMIDPSVRPLVEALKNGANPQGRAPQKVYNITQNISTPNSDPKAAAMSVVSRIAAAGIR